jgi:NAD(P)-dependent dehydrogenase (short-subunit alcohol dehydrogenase family)
MSKKIIITGASGGFGKLTVEALLKNGHQVAASMRNAAGKNQEVAKELEKAGAAIIEMDVSKTDSVEKGMAKAIETLGGLDVVINNAGRGVIGMQEHFTPEDFQELLDVNVVGVQRVNRAALPFLRNQGSGLLIHISSLLGRITLPFYGPYQATKWALEAMAENYRAELSPFGIQSVIVEPGGFPTTFMTGLMLPSDNTRNESYGEFMNVPQQMGNAFGEVLQNTPEQDPRQVALAIAELIEKPAEKRPFRTIVDFMPWKDGIQKYNEHMEELTQSVYAAFEMGDLLKVKK